MSLPGLARFRPLALQLGDEEAVLEHAVARLHELEPGDIAVLPEFVAWTEEFSDTALAALHEIAREHGLGIITTINLGPGLVEDLPGRDLAARYNAVVVLTPHGDFHVPQAKVTPQSFETARTLAGPGIGVDPYHRINRVRFDVGEGLLEVRFLVCSDLWTLTRLSAAALRCDLLVVPANFARGAELHAKRLLTMAREHGLARATLLVNAFHEPRDPKHAPLAFAVEELLQGDDDAGHPTALRELEDRAALLDGFRVCDEALAGNFVEMVNLPEREERIAVPRQLADAPLEAGEYPITIVL